jgi:opacity protein-like surface antigen
MNVACKLIVCLGLLPLTAAAQAPAITARGPAISVSAGYEYVHVPLAPTSHVSLNGSDVNLTIDVSSRIGIRLDVGYARAADVLGSGRHADLLSYLIGPTVYPLQRRKWAAYTQALIGASRITGPVPLATGTLSVGGYANKPSWALGGGIQCKVSTSFSFRGGADYLHTVYFSPSKTMTGQSDIRIVGSVVYTFGGRRR